MTYQQSNITYFLTSPSPNTLPQEDSIQPVKKKQKHQEKKLAGYGSTLLKSLMIIMN